MAKTLRKTMCGAQDACIRALMAKIEMQSGKTLLGWSVCCAKEYLLPLCAGDAVCASVLLSAGQYARGEGTLGNVKQAVKEAREAARRLEGEPIRQAATRAVAEAAAVIWNPTSTLAVAFYGSAAWAYQRLGLMATADEYNREAWTFCALLERRLDEMLIENEPNPVKINWGC